MGRAPSQQKGASESEQPDANRAGPIHTTYPMMTVRLPWPSATALALLLGSTPGIAQTPRQSFSIGSGTSIHALVSSGDHSVGFVGFGVSDNDLFITRSDGRGIEWTQWGSQSSIWSNDFGYADDIEVVATGDRMYALFSEGETSPSPNRIFSRRSTNGGDTWINKYALDVPVGQGSTNRIAAFELVPGTVDQLYALIETDPGVLALWRSLDSGSSYQEVSVVSTNYRFQATLEVEGDVVHMTYDEGVGDLEMFYRRSPDLGDSLDAPFSLGTFVSTDSSRADATAEGDRVLLVYGSETGVVQTRISDDGGVTIAPPVDHAGGKKITGDAVGVLMEDGAAVVTWEEILPSGSQAVTQVTGALSTNGGESWAPLGFQAETPSNLTPRTLLAYVGERFLLNVAYSTELGAILWDPVTLELSQPFSPLTVAAGSHVLAVNETYGNAIYFSESTSADIYVGGFRPQTFYPLGFKSGPSMFSTKFELFDREDDVAWLLYSASLGDFFLSDGRNLGILPDAFLSGSINLALSGIGSSLLDLNAAGETPTVPINLPPGFKIQTVGLGIDLDSGTIGAITDTLTLST